jgi:hypothetical protein
MSKSKTIFQEVRKTMGTNHDKSIIRYFEHQNADRQQIEHIQGTKQNWK